MTSLKGYQDVDGLVSADKFFMQNSKTNKQTIIHDRKRLVIPQKIKNRVTCDSAIPLLGIHLKTRKCVFEEIYTPLCSLKHYSQRPRHGDNKCLLIEDWIKKMWSIYTVEYYSAMRKDEILPFATMLMDLENIMLSE